MPKVDPEKKKEYNRKYMEKLKLKKEMAESAGKIQEIETEDEAPINEVDSIKEIQETHEEIHEEAEEMSEPDDRNNVTMDVETYNELVQMLMAKKEAENEPIQKKEVVDRSPSGPSFMSQLMMQTALTVLPTMLLSTASVLGPVFMQNLKNNQRSQPVQREPPKPTPQYVPSGQAFTYDGPL